MSLWLFRFCNLYLFSVEKKFSKQNSSIQRWSFFPFLEATNEAQTSRCEIVGDLHRWPAVSQPRGSRVIFSTTPVLSHFQIIVFKIPTFLTGKDFFWQNSTLLLNWFFHKTASFFLRNWKNANFFFENFTNIFSKTSIFQKDRQKTNGTFLQKLIKSFKKWIFYPVFWDQFFSLWQLSKILLFQKHFEIDISVYSNIYYSINIEFTAIKVPNSSFLLTVDCGIQN